MTVKSVGQTMASLSPGPFKTLTKINPVGSLQARKQVSGAIAFYWRYSIGLKSDRVLIGLYDSAAPPKALAPSGKGFSIAAAVRAAEQLADQHYQHRDDGGRPALLEAQRQAKLATAEAKRLAAVQTLGNMLDAYCDRLEALGRRSHADARGIFKLHVKEAWPSLYAMPAKEVTAEQIADMMRTLQEAKKGRTANKLRSYLRAAYQMALDARFKSSIPVAFKDFQIVRNPAADTGPDETMNQADKNPMSGIEMRSYWQAIKHKPGIEGAVLRLHLLTGAQRIEQLVNLRTADVGKYSIKIFDGKGRPGSPARAHGVPLIKAAREALAICAPAGLYALSTDRDEHKGETHLAATTLSGWAATVAAGAEIEGFQAKRLRSGVETLLARERVSKEHRGHLQSHGIAGVQSRHYDGHEYMEEKREALQALFSALEREEFEDAEPIPDSDLPIVAANDADTSAASGGQAL